MPIKQGKKGQYELSRYKDYPPVGEYGFLSNNCNALFFIGLVIGSIDFDHLNSSFILLYSTPIYQDVLAVAMSPLIPEEIVPS